MAVRKPAFAAPPSPVIRFSSKRQFFSCLREHRVPYREWEEKERSKAWKEVQEGDAVYCIDPTFATPVLVRCICVVAARVILNHPEHGMFVLVEFVRKGREYNPRRQLDSSLSEKMILDRSTGMPVERSVETIARCLEQETGIIVPGHELGPKAVTFMPRSERSQVPSLFGIGARYVEQEFGLGGKYPGLTSYRQIAHYKVELEPRYYDVRGHRDPGTHYLSFWRSVHEKETLEPIPAEIAERMKWAAA